MSKPAIPAVRTGQAELDNALLAVKQTLDSMTGQARNISAIPPLSASSSEAEVVNRINAILVALQGASAQAHVSTMVRPAFHATSNVATAVGQEIVYNLVSLDAGSNYNAANGRFTAPISGVYFFSFFGLYENADTGFLTVSLRKNSVNFPGMRFVVYKPASTWDSFHGSGTILLSAGDYVSPFFETGTSVLHTNPCYNGFSGHFVG